MEGYFVFSYHNYKFCEDMKEARLLVKQWRKEEFKGDINIYKLVKTFKDS